MSPTGPLYAGTAANNGAQSPHGTNNWTNTSNATGAPNGTYASFTAISGSWSSYLLLTGYGFSIPSTAVIDGITVTFTRNMSGANAAVTNALQMVKAGTPVGTLYGAQMSGGIPTGTVYDNWPASTYNQPITYGSSTNLWGTTWLPSDINNANFGVQIGGNAAGTANNNIEGIGITVYWHTAPAVIPRIKYYLYKVYDSITGAYSGNLPVSSDFALEQDVNTAAIQMTVDCALSADTSVLGVNNLTDESGVLITDEAGVQLTSSTAPPTIGVGTSGALIRNGNIVKVWEYSYYYPNGKCMFQGRMDRGTDNFGGDNGDNNTQLLLYSDATDLDDFMVTTQQTADFSDTTANSVVTCNFAGPAPFGQSITSGFGVTAVSRITLTINAFNNNNPVVTVGLYGIGTGISNLSRFAANGPPDATATQVISSTIPTTYDFEFNNLLNGGAGGSYFIFSISCSDPTGVQVWYDSGGSNGFGLPSGGITCTTYGEAVSTAPTYTNIDPSNIALAVLDNYGGKIQSSGTTVQGSGLVLPAYQFNTTSITSAMGNIMTLLPSGFYWYVDPGTDTFYLQKANQSADIVLTKGVHIDDLKFVRTTEYIVNTVYLVGGTDPLTNQTVYVFYQDAASVARYGQRSVIHTDSNITNQSTALIVARNIVFTNKDEQYQTQVTIVETTMDVTTLLPGKTIGFNGFGTYVDNLLSMAVHRSYAPGKTTLTLGLLPKRTSTAIEQTVRGLTALATVDNVSTPAS